MGYRNTKVINALENRNSRVISEMDEIYKRTMQNCLFYQEKGFKDALLNEIGVLRGVVYCMETVGLMPDRETFSDFLRFLDVQNERKKVEGSVFGSDILPVEHVVITDKN